MPWCGAPWPNLTAGAVCGAPATHLFRERSAYFTNLNASLFTMFQVVYGKLSRPRCRPACLPALNSLQACAGRVQTYLERRAGCRRLVGFGRGPLDV